MKPQRELLSKKQTRRAVAARSFWHVVGVASTSAGPVWNQLGAANVWLALGAMSIALTWGGYRAGDRYGLLVGFFLALGLNSLVLFYDDWRLAEQFPGKVLEGRDPWGLLSLVRGLSRQIGLATPQLIEVKSPASFILSAGLFASRLRIYYSSALLKNFSSDEITALFTLELLKFKSGQTRSLTAAVALVDMWLLLMNGLDAVFLFRLVMPRKAKRWRVGPISLLNGLFMALLLRLVIRRTKTFAIDREAAESFGDRQVLARSLSKLDSYAKTLPIDVNIAEAALFTAYPLAQYSWASWASVQPDMSARVLRLVGRFPL